MCVMKLAWIWVLCHALTLHNAESKVTVKEYKMMPKIFHLDDFDDCMDLSEKPLYCEVSVQLGPSGEQEQSKTWKIIQEMVSDPRNYRHDLLRHGICVPETCPNVTATINEVDELKTEISNCYTKKYEHLMLKAVVTEMHCENGQPRYKIDNLDIAVGVALAVLVGIVLFASFYEGRARYKSKKEYEKITGTKVGRIIACFAIAKNWNRLKSESDNPDNIPLKCIQGIRVYNLMIVIMVHAGLCTLADSVQNLGFAENLMRKPENIILANGLCAIQTFMIITGFLLSYNFFLIIEKTKNFRISYLFLAFIHRYIRLTPCLLVVLAINSTWLYHIGSGPTWDRSAGAEYRNCRQNGWSNLLYINNYYDPENMCMLHTWYLATDTQLFFVSLIVIGLMWRFQKHIKLILGLSIIIGFALPSAINYYYDFEMTIRMYPEALYSIFLKVPQFHIMYTSAAVNFGAYALGLTFGYLCYKRRNNKILKKKIYVVFWWILVWGLPISVVFYGILIYQEDYHPTRIGAAVYVAMYRGFFSLGICLMIYGCGENIGWLMRDALLWSPLQIVARVTYCTYLVHVAIIRVRAGQARHPSYITYYIMFTQTFGDAAMSFIFGTILTLFVELPISAIQKLMLPQKLKSTNANGVEQPAEAHKRGSLKETNHRF